MLILLFIAFISGLLTIFAPCVWPILPIIFATTSQVGKRRGAGLTLGIIVSFTLLTLSLSTIVRLLHLDPEVFRYLAVAVIGLMGLSLIFPSLGGLWERSTSGLTGRFGAVTNQASGFMGGFITGLSLGVVWTPCAGPILATVAALSAMAKVNTEVVLVMLFYMVGVGIPLFLFANGSHFLTDRMRSWSFLTGRIQKVFGGLMIIMAVLILTNRDRTLSVKLLGAFPSYTQLLLKVEGQDKVSEQLDKLKGNTVNQNFLGKPTGPMDVNLYPDLGAAPELVGITNWINSTPLTIASLKGKVVLVDFWTYTCINCIRALPYVTSWYDKYKDQGFVVVGVHTPEFEFEKKTENVASAIKQFGINYPVAQDNDYATWNAFNNQYWPAEYLIDTQGHVRRTHFGEGEYDKMEEAIRFLLAENNTSTLPEVSTASGIPIDFRSVQSPETYLGAKRNELLGNGLPLQSGGQKLLIPKVIEPNRVYFEGEWSFSPEFAENQSKGSKIVYQYHAKNVYLVMSSDKPILVQVSLDGKPISTIEVKYEKLYPIVQGADYGDHTLEITIPESGLRGFALTFG